MIDKKIEGISWIKLSKYNIINQNNGTNSQYNNMDSNCDIELSTNYHDIQSIPFNLKDNILRLRILCFDIECLKPASGKFPSAENDPIISIGVICTDNNDLHLSNYKYVLQMKETKPIHEANII